MHLTRTLTLRRNRLGLSRTEDCLVCAELETAIPDVFSLQPVRGSAAALSAPREWRKRGGKDVGLHTATVGRMLGGRKRLSSGDGVNGSIREWLKSRKVAGVWAVGRRGGPERGL